MVTIGRQIVCDKCKKEIFEKMIENEIFDKPYSRENTFAKTEGWETVEGRNLCPECYSKWKSIKESFFCQSLT